MRPLLIASAAALMIALPVSGALAHDHDWPLETDLTIEAALEIAVADGLTNIRQADFDDGVWEIEGQNAEGRSVEIHIDGASGEIIRR